MLPEVLSFLFKDASSFARPESRFEEQVFNVQRYACGIKEPIAWISPLNIGPSSIEQAVLMTVD